MLVIRLKRTGRRNDPSFKIVVGEKIYSPKSGKHLDYLGSYNPHTKVAVLDEEGIKKWMAQGAQLSDTMHNLMINKGVIKGKKINVLPKKTVDKPAEEAKAEEPKPAEEVKAEAETEADVSPEASAKEEVSPEAAA